MEEKEQVMIELTAEQHRLLAHEGTEPARAIDPATKIEYVLLPAAVYDRLRAMVADDTVYTTAEMLDRSMGEDDVGPLTATTPDVR